MSKDKIKKYIAKMSEEQRSNLHKKFFDGLPWKNAAERGELARKLFADVLNFKEVRVFTNLSKDEIIEKLNQVKNQANRFEMAKHGRETLAVGITWIGHKLQSNNDLHKQILAKHRVATPGPGKNNSEHFQWYETTIFGQPLCLNEYATTIAEGPSTHVLLIDDDQGDLNCQLEEYHIPETAEFHELVLEKRQGRQRSIFLPMTMINKLYQNCERMKNQLKLSKLQIPFHFQEIGVKIK